MGGNTSEPFRVDQLAYEEGRMRKLRKQKASIRYDRPITSNRDGTCDFELDTGQIGTAKWDFVNNRPDGPVYVYWAKQNKKPSY